MENCKKFYCIVTGILIATNFMIAELPHKIVNVLEKKVAIYIKSVST